MTASRARDLVLAAAMIVTVIMVATMIAVDRRSEARACRSTLPRASPPWALEKQHLTVVETTAAVTEMIDTIDIGSGVITGTGTPVTTPIQTRMQRATIAAGITGMAEAREM
jgi:hypothetical protein